METVTCKFGDPFPVVLAILPVDVKPWWWWYIHEASDWGSLWERFRSLLGLWEKQLLQRASSASLTHVVNSRALGQGQMSMVHQPHLSSAPPSKTRWDIGVTDLGLLREASWQPLGRHSIRAQDVSRGDWSLPSHLVIL